MKRTRDGDLARTIAAQAGAMLLDLRQDDDRRRAADVLADGYIRDRLAMICPDDVVFSEEAEDNPARLTARRVWIVDPLDGTREYREIGRSDWAVHIALWEDGHLVAGAVALPAQARVLSTGTVPAAAILPSRDRRRVVVSRSRPPGFAQDLANDLDADLILMGSAGAKVAAVIDGTADAYVHAGGQYEWDSAAPVAVALDAGLHASALDGRALVYNRPDPQIPDLLVCHRQLAPRIIEYVR